MKQELHIYNSFTRKKEIFKPLHPTHVGMYVCGPTVYSEVHLGNCRTFMSFDVIYRYLLHLGYKVRYVRNITDAGHLEGDRDEGDDKFAKRAKLEQLEPMEIVQKYTVGFREVMRIFNNLPPSIEPTATGHIIEQIEMVKEIMANGYAYEVDGSVYFNVEKYMNDFPYGKLSNRNMDDLLTNTRDLDGQDEKKGKLDFALWIKAKPEHIMRWPSPWSTGFPGWHLECSAMSRKYLGDTFDIHGGGMDLIPTHHTNEIAQNNACCKHNPANYWIHTNMLTVNGQKMSKSLGNSFLPSELFAGNHPLLEKGYGPMPVRFFMMQSHYSSTLDFSNEALSAAEKGYKRLMNALSIVKKINYTAAKTVNKDVSEELNKLVSECYVNMSDDFNTAKTLAVLFEMSARINDLKSGNISIDQIDKDTFDSFKSTYISFIEDVLGLKEEEEQNHALLDQVIHVLIDMRKKARQDKNFALSDKIRDELKQHGVQLMDGKNGEMNYVIE